ncbi:MAG TPA: hypothetical protein VLR90_05410 [Blastocatellia bacterium]|nr:hypothetical protein [Blastocatellia bacterium]
MGNLGPKYNCSRCDLPEKEIKGNLETDCPLCPVTGTFIQFKQEVEEEIKNRFGGFGEWPFDKLLAAFNDASRMLSNNRSRINPKWDATIANVCLIIRSEQEQARFIRLWSLRQSK